MTSGARDRRSLDVSLQLSGSGSGCGASGRPGPRTSLARWVHRRRRGTDIEPGTGRRLRGIHAALPRVVFGTDIAAALSAIPTTMIFGDHDVHDDWNISWRWLEMRAQAMVELHHRRLNGLLGHQHLGGRSRADAKSSAPPARRAALSCAGSLTNGTASPLRAAGPSTGTSATADCSSSTRGRRASSRTTEDR
jgi:hypothetical protein